MTNEQLTNEQLTNEQLVEKLKADLAKAQEALVEDRKAALGYPEEIYEWVGDRLEKGTLEDINEHTFQAVYLLEGGLYEQRRTPDAAKASADPREVLLREKSFQETRARVLQERVDNHHTQIAAIDAALKAL